MFAVLLVRIRLIDELGWMLGGAGEGAEMPVISKGGRTLSVRGVWCHTFAPNVQWVLRALGRCLIPVFPPQF